MLHGAGPEQLRAHRVRDHDLACDHALEQQQPDVLGVGVLAAGAPRPLRQPVDLDLELVARGLTPIRRQQRPEVGVHVE
jgi:hypothetical protein